MKHDETLDVEERIRSLRGRAAALRKEIQRSYLGSPRVLDLVLYSLLADGHVLLEGAPGLGKTTLVKALAASLDLTFQRIQFTPDLMPADIIGARILEETAGGGHSFRFERGPLFANVVLADEINRATPRTQSALLEAMEERQVTVFGNTMSLEEPFSVIATQNPIEMEGTYSLPEAQLDRFICKIELSAPGEEELIEILSSTTGPKEEVQRDELEAFDLMQMRSFVRQVPGSAEITRWVARTIRLSDPRNESAPESVRRNLRYGASPRGGQSILLLAKARALVEGRPWITEEDVECVARPALRHRLVFGYEGEASGIQADEIVLDALNAAR